MNSVRIFNPETRAFEEEKIYGEAGIRFLYERPVGKALRAGLTLPAVSKIYGWNQTQPSSAKKVPEFVKKFEIDLTEFEDSNYRSFNDFFIRKFKTGARIFPSLASEMGAPAEGRYLAWSNTATAEGLPIKGLRVDAKSLLDHAPEAEWFTDGPGMIARLCPVDYHRYHFCDDGKELRTFWVRGALESVSPIALKSKPEILITNERQVSILETKNFGRLAYIAVGAMMVGKICDAPGVGVDHKRGQEKGYFLFGASTVVILGEKGKWSPTPELLSTTQSGFETKVKLGQVVAQKR